MSRVHIPKNYKSPPLGSYDTQKAIGVIHILFEKNLCDALTLKRVLAPLFSEASLQYLTTTCPAKKAGHFHIKRTLKTDATQARCIRWPKWKASAHHDYAFHVGKGLYTEMNAISCDEELDNLHRLYVDHGTGRR